MRGNTFIQPQTTVQSDMPEKLFTSYPWHSATFALAFKSQNTLKHTKKKT